MQQDAVGKRVVKNTIYLYMKMCITMFLSLYTTRIILQSLGASDFGIFNVIGGTIAMLGFLNSTLAYATQRFMTYANGECNFEKQCKIFNVSLVLHILIAILTSVVQIVLMYPLFNGILNIGESRIVAAKIIYISLTLSTGITIINATYDAVINAHENMRLYSIIGVAEAIFRLFIALSCKYTSYDKLVFYGVLMSIVPLVTFLITMFSCHSKYSECVIAPRKYWDISLIREISTFSGWNFLTAISSLFSVQGVGLILNHFYGSKLNTAQGVAVQLNGYLSSFASNMLKAINPTIVKSAGANEIISMNRITLIGCKFSTYLLLLFAIPCVLEIKYLLNLWLGAVPTWTQLFCVLQIFQSIILQVGSPVATSVYAQGNIKHFSIYKSVMNLLPLLFTYISFAYGALPYWLYIFMISFYAIAGNIVILHYAKKNCEFVISDYINHVIRPVFFIILTMLVLGTISMFLISPGGLRFCITGVFTTIGFMLGLISSGTTKFEKQFIKSAISRLVSHIK